MRGFSNKHALFSVKAAASPDNIILLPLTLITTLFTLLLRTLDATLLWKLLAQRCYFSDCWEIIRVVKDVLFTQSFRKGNGNEICNVFFNRKSFTDAVK